jgi:hypothetical protein
MLSARWGILTVSGLPAISFWGSRLLVGMTKVFWLCAQVKSEMEITDGFKQTE